MADISFPAHLIVTEEIDDNGLPILTAVVTPADGASADPLPTGFPGPPGPRGVPGTTFAKQGEIANAGARPTGLTGTDRGKWWHRLDDNGMDVWDGTNWRHSPDAVGEQGPVADANALTVTTVHDPALTTPAVEITGTGAAQTMTVTVPAGLRGPVGPAGASGAISTATDFDTSTAPTHRSTFGLSPGGTQWRVQNPPNGFGPWSWYGSADFAADVSNTSADKTTMGTFTIPALPFRWRPLVFARLYAGSSVDGTNVVVYVRIGNVNGVVVASGAGARYSAPSQQVMPVVPTYGDEGTKPLSPSSTYATIPANQAPTLVVTVEREVGTAAYSTSNLNASLTVWALPVA